MDNKDFTELFDQTIEKMRSLLVVKGGEYAGNDDRLANFKRGAQLSGNTPLQVALIYMSKHYDAICTYVRKDAAGQEQVLSEPITGRLHDLMNYSMLILALINEQSNKVPASKSLQMTLLDGTKVVMTGNAAEAAAATFLRAGSEDNYYLGQRVLFWDYE